MFPLPDVNECDIGSHTCHVHAYCSNTAGSFECVCIQGFVGDGMTCEGSAYIILFSIKGVLHPRPILSIFVHFYQIPQHIGDN